MLAKRGRGHIADSYSTTAIFEVCSLNSQDHEVQRITLNTGHHSVHRTNVVVCIRMSLYVSELRWVLVLHPITEQVEQAD